jgi:hypothetical protein
MKFKSMFVACIFAVSSLHGASSSDTKLASQIQALQEQTNALQHQLAQLQHQLIQQKQLKHRLANKGTTHGHQTDYIAKITKRPKQITKLKHHYEKQNGIHESPVSVHVLDDHPESVEFYPTALIAEHNVVTFIAGTPVITAPYLGSRPSFDGSDYIVNISSINRDVRLMQQRRKLYRAFHTMGYSSPDSPIIALSGKAEPVGSIGRSYSQNVSSDWDLGSAELAGAAALNHMVEAFISLDYDPSPYAFSNQRISNSSVGLGMGFINIGDLDRSPLYLTAGQIYAPFGRFSSMMISTPLTTILGRTKTRPAILGYQFQGDSGPYAAVFGFRSDTTLDDTGVGGVNLGYIFSSDKLNGEFGASFISSINNTNGMQATGARPTLFGGFGSINNGNEAVKPVPAIDLHGILRFDRYNLTAEWVRTTQKFRTQDLSFNAHGAEPQALQLEAAATFMAFHKPSSFALGYQWSKETLALRIPHRRFSGVFNISIWRDTVESLEYRHDIDFKQNQFGNGAAPPWLINSNTYGTGQSADTVLARIGVYF